MRKQRLTRAAGMTVMVLILGISACAPSTSSYVHPDVDLSYIRRCAILPFKNLSQDSFADERMYSLFMLRVLREGSLQVVEPGAVNQAMNTLRLPPGTTLSPEQYVALGKELAVDGIFIGSIEEYGIARESRRQKTQLTSVFALVETQTGVTVWQAQVHMSGAGLFRRLFGTGSRSIHDLSRSSVNRALRTLF